MVQEISGISAVSLINQDQGVEKLALQEQSTSFGELLADKLESTNGRINEAEIAIHKMAQGQDIELHEAIIAMQRAKMELTLVVEVRNKVLEAYQEVMRMQV
jgi:flagellar hook-basal body complex protein FliE